MMRRFTTPPRQRAASAAAVAAFALALLLCGCADDQRRPAASNAPAQRHERHAAHARDGVLKLSRSLLRQIKPRSVLAARRALAGVIESTGEVAFDQDRVAHVSPRADGRVHRVRAKLGDDVKRAQVLVLLDSIELGRAKADYLRARAELRLARQNRKREEKLLAERITSLRDVLAARAAHDKALAHYRTARQTLRLLGLSAYQVKRLRYDKRGEALLAVRAPIAGRIIKKHVTLGELVTPKQTLFTVADLSRLWIWIDVYERDLAHVHLDDTVEVRVKAYPKRVFTGKVSYVGDEIDRKTRAVRARLDVKNPDHVLKPGMFARVRLSDPHDAKGKRRRDVLAIPSSAVVLDGKRRFVFIELQRGRYRRQPVTLGTRDGRFVEVKRGLVAGQRVVTRGAFLLKSEAAKHRLGGGHGH